MASNSKLYKIGLRSKHATNGLPCPLQYFSFAGFTFHQYTEKVQGYGAATRRERVQGGYANLTDEQKEKILSELEDIRVQFLSTNPDGSPKVVRDDTLDPPRDFVRARIVKTDVTGYIPRESDLKLHGWLFMEEADAPAEFEFSDPPALVEASRSESSIVQAPSKSRKS